MQGKLSRVRFVAFPFGAAVRVFTVLSLQPRWVQAAVGWAGQQAVTLAKSSLLATHLYEIQVDAVELEAFSTWGGAIEPLKDHLLLATPRGRLALIDSDSRVEYLPVRVPMNESASEKPLKWIGFRVADILLHELEPDRFTLFVSHHFFGGSCVEFRISSTSLNFKDSEIEVSGEWKTEFIATPCIDSEIFNFAHRGGIQAGGRMLMDGPDHLLLVTGDQAYFEWYQEEHPLEPPPAGEHNMGPYLDGVIGRRAGEVAGFNATAALTALEIVWTRENLAEFIVSPAQFAPGTTMAGVGVSEEEAQLIVEFLAADQ